MQSLARPRGGAESGEIDWLEAKSRRPVPRRSLYRRGFLESEPGAAQVRGSFRTTVAIPRTSSGVSSITPLAGPSATEVALTPPVLPSTLPRVATDHQTSRPLSRSTVATERLPIVVAVTGHRDPADPAALAGEITGLLAELDAIAPLSPFVMLSPLAEGADRIFARACLEFRGSRRLWPRAAGMRPHRTLAERLGRRHPTPDPTGGIFLIAPLPMPQEEYEQGFTDRASLEEFRALLTEADASFELPLPSGCTLEALRSERRSDPHRFGGRLRNRQYQRLGLFIAMQSSLVVACWNGRDPGRLGGAAAIVRFCRSGRIEPDAIPFHPTPKELEPEDPTPVAVIVTPRRSDSASPPAPPPRSLEERLAWRGDVASAPVSPESTLQRLALIERLNGAIASTGRAAPSVHDVPPSDPGPGPIELRRLASDRAAIGRMRRWRRVTVGLVALIAAAVVALQALMAWSLWPFAILYLVGLGLAFLCMRFICRARVEGDAADLRLLCEALRVQRWWSVAGVREQVADHYLSHRAIDLCDLRRVLRGATIELFEPRRVAAPPPAPAAAGRQWIEGQLAYFSRQVLAKDVQVRRGRRTARIASAVVVLTATLALVALLGKPWPLLGDDTKPLLNWLDFLSGASLTAAFAIGLILKTRGDEEDRVRFDRIRQIFEIAAIRLDEVAPPALRPERPSASPEESTPPTGEASSHRNEPDAAVTAILRALGKEALDENAAWHAAHRDTLRDLPAAG
jgi:hypothetical protein